MDKRTCTKCGETKPATLEFFARNTQFDPNGLRPECKTCQHKAGATYRAQNRDKLNAQAAVYRASRRKELADKSREYHQANREVVLAQMRAGTLKHEYGLSPEQYGALFDAQGGGCAFCGRGPQTKSLHVDHDHLTGKIRGLLCPPCNTALGILGDDVAGLLRAIEYLRTADERMAAVLPEGPAFQAKARRYARADVLEVVRPGAPAADTAA